MYNKGTFVSLVSKGQNLRVGKRERIFPAQDPKCLNARYFPEALISSASLVGRFYSNAKHLAFVLHSRDRANRFLLRSLVKIVNRPV